MIEQFLGNPVASQFVGLLVGLFASFFSWWVLFRWMSPKIVMSDSISKMRRVTDGEGDNSNEEFRYRFKCANMGRRAAIDVQFTAALRTRPRQDAPTNIVEVVRIPLDEDGETPHLIPIMLPVRRSGRRTSLPFCINLPSTVEKLRRSGLLEDVKDRSIKLEELLDLHPKAELKVVAAATDEFTGAKKVFVKTFTKSDIKEGPFHSKGLEVRGVPDAKH